MNRNQPAIRSVLLLKLLFTSTIAMAAFLPSLVLICATDKPQHGWNTSSGDMLWLTTIFAPGLVILGSLGHKAIRRVEQGIPVFPEPAVLGGAAIGALVVSGMLLVDGVTDPTSGIVMAIPGTLLASQVSGALAGAVITGLARRLSAGRTRARNG